MTLVSQVPSHHIECSEVTSSARTSPWLPAALPVHLGLTPHLQPFCKEPVNNLPNHEEPIEVRSAWRSARYTRMLEATTASLPYCLAVPHVCRNGIFKGPDEILGEQTGCKCNLRGVADKLLCLPRSMCAWCVFTGSKKFANRLDSSSCGRPRALTTSLSIISPTAFIG